MTKPIEPMIAEQGQLGHPDLVQHRLRLQPQVIPICDNVWTIFGVSLANCHIIRGSDGLIVIDTGHSGSEGTELRRLIRSVCSEPVRAVLYTHLHYTRGTATLLDGDDAVIIGHPQLDSNIQRTSRSFSGQRNILETGASLPQSGSDAVIAPAPQWRDASAYLPPTHTHLPGDGIRVAGVTIEIQEGCFDSDDGLAFLFPDYDLIAHNLVTGQFPNFGSLAGGRYRDPLPWLRAVDYVCKHPTEYALPCHGLPRSGRQNIAEHFQINHQAIQYLYDHVQAAAAQGASIPDIMQQVRLPEQLAKHPLMRQIYGTAAHAVQAFAIGEMGFWSGEIRDLLPLHPNDEAAHLCQLVGGPGKLLEEAQRQDLDPAWALRLADAAARCGEKEGLRLRAELLRQAALRSSAWTERNTMLSLSRMA
ncbi:MAG: MBL fold metallo-hydrolase [Planctomycetota bacterium]|nr:MAG: MBL fold metallo-hydrolase [Planctomycetota bacterium]